MLKCGLALTRQVQICASREIGGTEWIPLTQSNEQFIGQDSANVGVAFVDKFYPEELLEEILVGA